MDFTFFDPHDFLTDKLLLKGMTSQLKRHFNVADDVGGQRWKTTSSGAKRVSGEIVCLLSFFYKTNTQNIKLLSQ